MTSTKKNPAVLQGEQDAHALMLHCAKLLLSTLECVDSERDAMGEKWLEEYYAVSFAVNHVADCVRGWVADLPERATLERRWWGGQAVLALAVQSFPNKDTPYWRLLNGANEGMLAWPEIWQTVADGIPQLDRGAGHGTL